jgi:hypothetical protein
MTATDTEDQSTPVTYKRKTCSDCRYFNVLDGGQCRKGPPTLVPMVSPGGLQLASAWPPVKDSMWCGEFRSTNES